MARGRCEPFSLLSTIQQSLRAALMSKARKGSQGHDTLVKAVDARRINDRRAMLTTPRRAQAWSARYAMNAFCRFASYVINTPSRRGL